MGAIPHESMVYVLHIKHKNDMHVPPALHGASNYRLFGSWTIKIEIQSIHTYNLFDELLKRLIKCVTDEAGSVVGATLEGMGRDIL